MRGKEAAGAQDQRITIGHIMERYIEDRRVEGKRVETMRYNWKKLKKTFEHRQPDDLSARIEVEGEQRTLAHKYVRERELQGAARDTICTELGRLRTAVKWAAKQKLVEAVPQSGCRPKAMHAIPGPHRRRSRPLERGLRGATCANFALILAIHDRAAEASN